MFWLYWLSLHYGLNFQQTPLHIAAREGNTPIVELMSEKNANFNIQDENGVSVWDCKTDGR